MMQVIPKIIHFVWMGKQPYPDLIQKCLDSWKLFAQDYDIMVWDESNFDISSNQYVKEAYESKKWAFVSDYVRLYVLYHYGGIYLDSDVELIRPIDDLLDYPAFSGFEQENTIPTAIMGAQPHHPWIYHLLSYYDQRPFILSDGSFDLTTNVVTITKMTQEKYGVMLNNQFQQLDDGLTLFPTDYFCPKSYDTGKIKLTSNTYCIHHFNGSWLDEDLKEEKIIFQKLRRRFGNSLGYVAYRAHKRMKTEGVLSVLKRLITVPTKKLFDLYEYQILKILRLSNPVSKNVYFFESEGDYVDNARALFEYMIHKKMNENNKMIWKVKDVSSYTHLKQLRNVKVVSSHSRLAKMRLHFLLGSVKYFFFTHPYWMKEWKKNQTVINLWHGTPIKNAGSDLSHVFDHVIVSSEHTAPWMSSFLGSKPNQNVVLGAPRNDLLFSTRPVKEILGLSPETKLIMCLPTYKQSTLWSDSDTTLPFGMQNLHTMNDVQILNQQLKEYNMHLIIKLHHLQVTDHIQSLSLSNISFLQNKDLDSLNLQLYECLSATDILLTDYSSVYFDYLLLNRPIGFLHEDIESYLRGRGFLFDDYIDYMPGEKIHTLSQLLVFLSDCHRGKDDYNDQRLLINDKTNRYVKDNCQRLLQHFDIIQ